MSADGNSSKISNLSVWIIAISVLALCSLGIVILSSIGAPDKPDHYFFVKRQIIYLVIALVAGIFAAFVNLKTLKKLSIPIALFSLLLLLLVLIPKVGVEVNGARRWLEISGQRFQPSDLAKISLVLVLSAYLGKSKRDMDTFWRGFVIPLIIVGAFCSLIILEPDFGTTALCGGVGFSLIFLSGARLKYLLPSLLMLVLAFCVMVWLDPVRLARVLSFLDFEANKQTGGWQLYQSVVAFASGGVSGTGVGEGRQHLSFLPEAHTDFVFAPIGEQLGLFATLGVAAAFLMIFLSTVSSLKKAPNLFEFCVATGSLLMIVGQALFNMCVVTGLLPTKGISLPFISYGGSNLVAMFAFTGLILNCLISWNRPQKIKVTSL